MTEKAKEYAPWVSIAIAVVIGLFGLVGWIDHEFARKNSLQRVDENVQWIKNYLIERGG